MVVSALIIIKMIIIYNNSSGLPPSEVADAGIKTTYRNAIIGRLTLMYFNLGQLIAAGL